MMLAFAYAALLFAVPSSFWRGFVVPPERFRSAAKRYLLIIANTKYKKVVLPKCNVWRWWIGGFLVAMCAPKVHTV